MATSRVSYCSKDDVLARMYSGQGGAAYGADANRDAFIITLIQAASRRWEQLTGRPPNGFAPVFEPRRFSGMGAQELHVDEFAALYQIEIDITPGRTPSYTDVTSDFIATPWTMPPAVWSGFGRIEPMKFWPKDRLFRMQTFYVDPYRYGNVIITALWGCVQPDTGLVAPTGNTGHYFPPYNLTDDQILALQPTDALGANIGGWWTTPEDVVDIIARWVLYIYKASSAAYSDQAGTTATAVSLFSKQVPQFVMDLVEYYTDKEIPLAMITPDGIDIGEERVYGLNAGTPSSVSRWSGWTSHTP